MQDLIREYKESLKKIREAIRSLENKPSRTYDDLEDMRFLESMARDLVWAIEWMETGHKPENKRDVKRLAGYQREFPIDPADMDMYTYQTLIEEEQPKVSQRDMRRIKDALSVLSTLEREVYVMSRGHGLSYSEIAMLISVVKGTVQKVIQRAERKMSRFKKRNNSLSRKYI